MRSTPCKRWPPARFFLQAAFALAVLGPCSFQLAFKEQHGSATHRFIRAFSLLHVRNPYFPRVFPRSHERPRRASRIPRFLLHALLILPTLYFCPAVCTTIFATRSLYSVTLKSFLGIFDLAARIRAPHLRYLLSGFAKDIKAIILLHFADAVQLTERGPPPLLGGIVEILTFLVLRA